MGQKHMPRVKSATAEFILAISDAPPITAAVTSDTPAAGPDRKRATAAHLQI